MRRTLWLAVSVTILMIFLLAAAGSARPTGANAASNEGCVNQGSDIRVGAPVVCWAQRHLSWKSPHKPHFWLIGKPAHTSLGLAWPPYIVYNSPNHDGGWRMFRIGFRYDRNWHGYIFPTAAWKIVGRPLRY